MTGVQYVENVLRNRWASSITGRPHDVGNLGGDLSNDEYVRIVYEGDKDWRSMDLSNYDYLTLTGGGFTSIEPKAFGWTEEDRFTRVDIDIRTSGHVGKDRPGRIALYGERGAGNLSVNEKPRWGGLVGETLRVMKDVRKGDQEFTIIDANEADELSGQMGGQIWRSVVSVRLENRNRTIDTST